MSNTKIPKIEIVLNANNKYFKLDFNFDLYKYWNSANKSAVTAAMAIYNIVMFCINSILGTVVKDSLIKNYS